MMSTARNVNRDPVAMIAGPWPSYGQFAHLSEQARWAMYGCAKRQRDDMERNGFRFAETYDRFIVRVARELGV